VVSVVSPNFCDRQFAETIQVKPVEKRKHDASFYRQGCYKLT